MARAGSVRSDVAGANLDKFFEDVEVIKDEMKKVERIHRSLQDTNKRLKMIHDASPSSARDRQVIPCA